VGILVILNENDRINMVGVAVIEVAQRPYLNNFDATGSPCHELTSWDNSSSMSI
jgi:hypothetical protein